MSLSRSPSPTPGGGWSSPGLNINGSGRSSPKAFDSNGGASHSGDFSRSRNTASSKYPSFSTQNQGFFTRHMRQLSSSLPRFNADPVVHGAPYTEKDKPVGGSRNNLLGRIRLAYVRTNKKVKVRALVIFALLAAIFIFYHSRE